MRKIALATLLLYAAAAILGPKAGRATTLSAIGGLNLGRSVGSNELRALLPLLGAEYLFDVGRGIEVGGLGEESFLSNPSGESGSIQYGGVLARAHLVERGSGPFLDASFGIARRMQGESSSGSRWSVGGGVGYELALPGRFSVSPRLGVRLLPESVSSSVSQPVLDGCLLFSVRF